MKSIVIAAAATIATVAMLGLSLRAEAAELAGGNATAIHYVPNGGSYSYQQFYGNSAYGYRLRRSYFGTPHGFHRWNRHGYAQYYAGPVLSKHAVIRVLRAYHFRHITRVRLRGGVYQARARDANGRRVRLEIDPYSGAIIGLRYR